MDITEGGNIPYMKARGQFVELFFKAVSANAQNPASQSILQKYFKNGVSPVRLALDAIISTIIMGCSFMILP
jgi:hypothetical protein